MVFNHSSDKKKLKKAIRVNVFTKLLLTSVISVVIPVMVAGFLIIYSYQSIINEFLAGQTEETIKKMGQELLPAFQNIKIQAILTLLIIIILALFGNILVARHLTRSLRRLVKGVEEVGKGNLDFKIKVEAGDELGELTSRFNEMAQQLKEAKSVLEESKDVLEIRVKARTSQLAEMTAGLEEKIKERTKELQERIEELEKFHKLTVGRELKMIELKQEINKLKTKLKGSGKLNN